MLTWAVSYFGALQADPSIAFPGQRAYEVVRPLIELLHPDIEGRPNYDALLTLTNLVSLSNLLEAWLYFSMFLNVLKVLTFSLGSQGCITQMHFRQA